MQNLCVMLYSAKTRINFLNYSSITWKTRLVLTQFADYFKKRGVEVAHQLLLPEGSVR